MCTQIKFNAAPKKKKIDTWIADKHAILFMH